MTVGYVCTCGWQVGPRLKSDRERFVPNNILLMIAGGGLLWMGWAGFNGGAPYAANIAASVAVLNTNVSAATSLLTWTCLDVIFFGKPSVIGAVQGMMTGLVCITPGAGNSNPSHPFILDSYSQLASYPVARAYGPFPLRTFPKRRRPHGRVRRDDILLATAELLGRWSNRRLAAPMRFRFQRQEIGTDDKS
jgi:hypothetical protein